MTRPTRISATEVAKRMKDGTITVFDIREPNERHHGYIEGSVSLPLSALDRSKLTLTGGQEAVFHCKSGMRTDAACGRLAEHVAGDVLVMDGGLNAWVANGLPLARG